MDSMTIQAPDFTPTRMWRKTNGQLAVVEPKREEYNVPVKGQYRLKYHGIAEPFEMDDTFNPGQKVRKTRVEFLIVKSRNRGSDGKLFSNLFTWSLSEKSNLGNLMATLRGGPIRPGEKFDVRNPLGIEFDAMVKVNDKGTYATVVIDSIMVDDDGQQELPEAEDDPFNLASA